jgi:hypothetical protein
MGEEGGSYVGVGSNPEERDPLDSCPDRMDLGEEDSVQMVFGPGHSQKQISSQDL